MPDIKPFTVVDDSVKFGAYCIVWSFTTIGRDVQIGDNCSIGSNCYIGLGSKLGNEVRINHGTFLPNFSYLGDRVFIGPNVTFTDDKHPRVNNHNYEAQPPILEDGCSIGANATILPGIRIGRNAMVGAGAVVVQDVPANSTVIGCPAHIITPHTAIKPAIKEEIVNDELRG